MRNLNLDPKNLLKRWGPPILLLLAFLAFVIWINQVDKTQLVSREGQTFEKGVVTEVVQDNLQPDGTRVGEQRVRVQMTTGVRFWMQYSSKWLVEAGLEKSMTTSAAPENSNGSA